MPTNTFFRLSEDKRNRLLEAAWAEFTRVSFAEASINRIIQEAHIPRGSFYQYFSGKEDLLLCILGDLQKQLFGNLEEIISRLDGDLFRMPISAYDYFLARNADTEQPLKKAIQIFHLNPSYDWRNIILHSTCLHALIIKVADTSKLRQQSLDYIRSVVSLLFFCLGSAIVDTMFDPTSPQKHRQALEERISIIRFGCEASDPAAACFPI